MILQQRITDFIVRHNDSAQPINRIRKLSFLLLIVCTALLLLALHACGQESIVQTQSELQAKSQGQNQIMQTESGVRTQSNNRQFFKWKSVNIQGMGYVTGLAIAPISPYDVYIRTDIGGAYRFIRKTNQWLPLLDMFDTNFAKGGIGVESIAIDPTLPKRIYVAVNHQNSSFKAGDGKMQYKYAGEVMVSDNQGGSWKSTDLGKNNIYVGSNNAYRSDTGERLAVDPNKSGLLYFASRRDGLWKKDSQGWTRVLGGLPDPSSLPAYKNPNGSDNEDIPGFTFVAFDKNSGSLNNPTQTIYVGVHGSGVWRSMNGGTSWSNIAGGNDPLRSAIASDGTLYVSFGTIASNGNKVNGGVRQYKNGAWTDITPDGTDKVYSAVTVQPNQANTVMAISDKYVYRSTDGGKKTGKSKLCTWVHMMPITPKTQLTLLPPGYYQSYAATGASVAVIDPSNPKQVWWTNGWGVARTDDVTVANPNYKWLMNNLEELDINILRVPPKPKAQGGADLLSAVQDMIGFRHENRNLVPTAKIDPQGIPINPGYKWANPDWLVYPQPFPPRSGGNRHGLCLQKTRLRCFCWLSSVAGFLVNPRYD